MTRHPLGRERKLQREVVLEEVLTHGVCVLAQNERSFLRIVFNLFEAPIRVLVHRTDYVRYARPRPSSLILHLVDELEGGEVLQNTADKKRD